MNRSHLYVFAAFLATGLIASYLFQPKAEPKQTPQAAPVLAVVEKTEAKTITPIKRAPKKRLVVQQKAPAEPVVVATEPQPTVDLRPTPTPIPLRAERTKWASWVSGESVRLVNREEMNQDCFDESCTFQKRQGVSVAGIVVRTKERLAFEPVKGQWARGGWREKTPGLYLK